MAECSNDQGVNFISHNGMGDVLDDNLEADTFESFNETLSKNGSDTFDNQKQKRRRKNVKSKGAK